MKIIDKLKNALFEEEYVEVEEKPKKKDLKKEIIKEKSKKEKLTKEIEEKPIAKKIVQPKEEKEEENDEHIGKSLAFDVEEKQEFKFPMVSDSEFEKQDEELENPEFLFDEEDYNRNKVYQPKVEKKDNISKKLPQAGIQKKEEHKPYGLDEFKLETSEYGLYEKKEDRTYFKPSPIISPIYGILDKDYRKEEIIPKREVRLTSTYAREKINVDDVRNKAFGIENDDVEKPTMDREEIKRETKIDLSSDNKMPEVKKVTVGDAEEYFEDLGLEYNVDYKDASKEATGRRSTKNKNLEEKIEKKQKKDVKPTNIEKNDDNLFDLIDSMYDNE